MNVGSQALAVIITPAPPHPAGALLPYKDCVWDLTGPAVPQPLSCQHLHYDQQEPPVSVPGPRRLSLGVSGSSRRGVSQCQEEGQA